MKNELKNLLQESTKFRNKLVSNMQNLESQSIDCKSCTGVCCTVSRNSMQVTPLEAFDLYFYLEENIQDKVTLWSQINESVSKYGLDREIYIKGKLFRKNYTCPLFKLESWGCPVVANLKPLGCLGYNALGEKVLEGENCSSDILLLESVEADISTEWNELNNKIKKLLKIDFDKLPIPNALLYCQKLFNS